MLDLDHGGEEGVPPLASERLSEPGVAVGAWAMVFEAIGATAPHEHMLHHAPVLRKLSLDERWQPLMLRVRQHLSDNGIDRRQMQQQQYITREGRSHLLQSAILRTAKHISLDPGDWSLFSPTLERWLHSTQSSPEELMAELAALFIPLSDALVTATARSSPSARSAVGASTPHMVASRRQVETPRLSGRPASGIQSSESRASPRQAANLQLQVALSALEEEKRKHAEEIAEVAVLSGMRGRLESMRVDLEGHPLLKQQELQEQEAEWTRTMEQNVAKAKRQQEQQHAKELADLKSTQESCLAKMVEYVRKIEADKPDDTLTEVVSNHASLVSNLRTKLVAMEQQQAEERRKTVERHERERDEQSAAEKRARLKIEEKISHARGALKESLTKFTNHMEAQMSQLRADIEKLLTLVQELRATWIDAPVVQGDDVLAGLKDAENHDKIHGEENRSNSDADSVTTQESF